MLRGARRAYNRGRPWHDTRAVLNGVLWVLGTGAQWRELPEKYPPFQTGHRRFQQWVRNGRLEEAKIIVANGCASEMGPEVVRALVRAGADVNGCSGVTRATALSRGGAPGACGGRTSVA